MYLVLRQGPPSNCVYVMSCQGKQGNFRSSLDDLWHCTLVVHARNDDEEEDYYYYY